MLSFTLDKGEIKDIGNNEGYVEKEYSLYNMTSFISGIQNLCTSSWVKCVG